MKLKLLKILSALVAALEGVCFLVVIGFSVNQGVVRQLYSNSNDLPNVIPIESLLNAIVWLLFYLIFMGYIFAFVKKQSSTTGSAVLFLVVGCLLKIILGIVPNIITMVYARQLGETALASYSALNTAIGTICNPIAVVAFALFCFCLGGLFAGNWIQETE